MNNLYTVETRILKGQQVDFLTLNFDAVEESYKHPMAEETYRNPLFTEQDYSALRMMFSLRYDEDWGYHCAAIEHDFFSDILPTFSKAFIEMVDVYTYSSVDGAYRLCAKMDTWASLNVMMRGEKASRGF